MRPPSETHYESGPADLLVMFTVTKIDIVRALHHMGLVPESHVELAFDSQLYLGKSYSQRLQRKT
jgi:hypothetical protein